MPIQVCRRITEHRETLVNSVRISLDLDPALFPSLIDPGFVTDSYCVKSFLSHYVKYDYTSLLTARNLLPSNSDYCADNRVCVVLVQIRGALMRHDSNHGLRACCSTGNRDGV